MFRVIVFCILVCVVSCEEFKIIQLDQGTVKGQKFWNGDFYEFYGVPYATLPRGNDKFKAPLPVKPWKGVLEATSKNIVCQQCYYSGDSDEDSVISSDDQCLVLNLFVPLIASQDNLVPVVVYIHSGAFAAGNGNMAKYQYLARHDVLVISINYRLGAIGFACLGTEDVPGNAAMKDQVAALRWINKNIEKFGGDPNEVTVAGYSVGAAMAELLALSKTTHGLIDKIILDSGSALSPYAVNTDPISTAKNIAISVGYNGTGTPEDLSKFYLNASTESLAVKSVNFFLTNGTFGFAPCVENVHKDIEPFLTESPVNIIKRGDYQKVSVLTGFANMEGISRALKFDTWSEMMNENFSDFLPADLVFSDDKSRDSLINDIRQYYFKGEDVSPDNLQAYIDYFSDSMFKYSILKSAKLHSSNTERPIYLYQFSHVGSLSMKHKYMDIIKGASHRDQTSYILDFFGFTKEHSDYDMRDRMSMMWADFIKYENPTEYESALVSYKWKTYSNKSQNYLEINERPELKKGLNEEAYVFWDNIYREFSCWKLQTKKK